MVLSILMSQTPLPVTGGTRFARAAADSLSRVELYAPGKESVGVDDTDNLNPHGHAAKSNVLFLIESTAVMSFTPKGVMPMIVRKADWYNYGKAQDNIDWNATKITMSDINYMMEQATFGMGALPAALSGGNLRRERSLYGRDVDPTNNYTQLDPKDPKNDLRLNAERGRHYYAPFLESGAALSSGYSGQTTPLNARYSNPLLLNASGKYSIVYNPGGHTYAYQKKETHPYPKQYNADKYLMGASETFPSAYNNLGYAAYPYALVKKHPSEWKRGGSGELVPNDSRMYQAKLVLWRLLEEEKDGLLKNIRLGLASTFLSLTNFGTPSSDPGIAGQTNAFNRYDMNGIFKVDPFGGSTLSLDGKGRFWNGTMNHAITGQPAQWSGIHGQLYPLWMNAPISPVYDPNPNPEWNDSSRETYKLLNRASLHVPIADADYVWRTADGRGQMSQYDKVRMWINGFADIKGTKEGWTSSAMTYLKDFMEIDKRNSQHHFFKDPEIGIAGTFQLPMSIFPNPKVPGLSRREYLDKGYIWYSAKDRHVNYLGDFHAPGGNWDFYYIASPRAHFNAGSGEAAGSVLDFFSPPRVFTVSNKSVDPTRHNKPLNAIQVALGDKNAKNVSFQKDTTRVTQNDLAPISFPIREACEDNWLVILAAGQEMETTRGREGLLYPAWEAIKNLYDATDPKKGKTVNSIKFKADGTPDLNANGTYKYVDVKLGNPIRTLVIGIVADPAREKNAAARKTLEKMRANIKRMARAGMGRDPNDESADVPCIFAENVNELSAALRLTLNVINENSVKQPGKGALVQSPPIGDETVSGAESNVYQITYRIVRNDQWDATLTRYVGARDSKDNLTLTKDWELGSEISRDIGKRNPRYWKANDWVEPRAGDIHFARMTGMTNDRMDASNLPGGTFGSTSPSDALIMWLRGYDYSYSEGRPIERRTMLGDFGHSGVVFAKKPNKISPGAQSLPGYSQWTNVVTHQEQPKIYAQTNDGILHVVNASSGREEMAILPPPVLVPYRLASLKTHVDPVTKKQRWNDVRSNASYQIRSNPSFTLDGPLQKRDFDLDQNGDSTGWGSYLLGSLGRGGNGLYMMDISRFDEPKFMWYVEHAGSDIISMSAGDAQPAVQASAGNAFDKLGLNGPKPSMGVTSTDSGPRNIIVVPGGQQSDINLAQNGNEGATLLFLDPKDGSVIRAFDTNSMKDSRWRAGAGATGTAPYMGMMISEPALARSENGPHTTGRVYAMDNRGNIFRADLEGENGEALASKNWQIRTAGTLQTDKKGALNYANPYGVAIAREGNATWVAGGTADLNTRTGSPDTPEGVLANESQFIFSYRISDSDTKTVTRSDLEELLADKSGNGKRGWYIPLQKSSGTSFREYVSAKPLLADNVLYAATFIRRNRVNVNSTANCEITRAISGDARLYALDIRTGAPTIWTDAKGGMKKYIEVEGIKITGLTLLTEGSKKTVVGTFERFGGDNLAKVVAEQDNLSDITIEGGSGYGGGMFGIPHRQPSGGGVNLEKGRNVILNWRTY
ncbi:MAG: hypothetical protein LBS75_06620 [Synergistaceae bacterium]|jgi:hypothetical protein|nr:hypothetical protein [Synergistaceae bacterium]